MKVVHKKTHDYVCHNCDKQYNWQQGKSVVYGKREYKTIQERKAIEKHFCSQECYYIWKNVL
ncbi:MAG: hypothetical protein GY739_00825 [Mesoflavibacter sp.]|nr:hypothetical protein [Mesoflavibacter sp.]